MKKKPYVLLSNDDGISSRGIKMVYNAIKDQADVIIAAPKKEKSGAANSVTIWNPIGAEKVKFCDTYGYAVDGTPVDCVKLAVLNFTKRKPDLIISGINHGPNFGRFILYSGTVGAATEAVLQNIPAISISLDNFDKDADFTYSGKVIKKVFERFLSGRLKIGKNTMININVPKEPEAEIKGYKILPKGNCEYNERYVHKQIKGKNTYQWWIDERAKSKDKKMPDSVAVRKGYVVITPLHIDSTDHSKIAGLKKQLKDIL